MEIQAVVTNIVFGDYPVEWRIGEKIGENTIVHIALNYGKESGVSLCRRKKGSEEYEPLIFIPIHSVGYIIYDV